MSENNEQSTVTSEVEVSRNEPEQLKQTNQQKTEQLQATAGESLLSAAPEKTQGVKPPRDSGVGMLGSAAKKAARSNSRSDVHEYMRLRRNFV